MNKIWLIIQREYLVRVRKKSFIIMTLLTPILFAALMVVPAWIANSSAFKEDKNIQVLDQSKLFGNKLKSTEKIKFQIIDTDSLNARKDFEKSKSYALLIIPKMTLANPQGFKLVGKKNVSFDVENYLEDELERIIRDERMLALNIKQEDLDKTKAKVRISTETQEGKESSSGIIYAVSFLGAILIYMSVLLYGVQVMRSVIEEKTNRIVEVMISSVKPVQLMLGKILGVAAVGLTQFLLWILLTFAISTGVSAALGVDAKDPRIEQMKELSKNNPNIEKVEKKSSGDMLANINKGLSNLNIPLIIGCFLFYFVFGYLLYSAMFAAVGSAGDNETEAQQFTLPVSLPLILGFILAQSIINEPNGGLAFWMSMIPFTSPVVMMVRVASGVPTWELILSMSLLIGGFLGITWVAARIYRVGILMYGKKVNFKEIIKWMIHG
ncbi:ABC transporter permease [bacterium 336/3]|nr:ABC transporter permease [bacterium 336/3]